MRRGGGRLIDDRDLGSNGSGDLAGGQQRCRNGRAGLGFRSSF
jgi:hypothetical protein